MSRPTNRDDDDGQQQNDTDNQAHPHLHVLPPHLFPNPVRATAEALGGHGEVVGLVLQRIQVLIPLSDLVDVLAHDPDRIIDLLGRELMSAFV